VSCRGTVYLWLAYKRYIDTIYLKKRSKMKNKRRLIIAIVVIGLVAGAAAFLWLANNNGNQVTENEPVSFRLKWVIYSSFAHHFVALEKGYYAEEGLQVDIQTGGAGIDPIRLVASGEDDLGLASYAQILLAREKGIPVVAIAEEYITSGVVFISLKESGIMKPSDFVGKKVGVIPGSDTGTVYEALMKKEGIDRSQIEEITIGFDLTVLFSGIIDVSTVAFITNQPIFAEQQGYPVNIINPYDYGIRPGGNVFFTSEKTLKEKRDVLKRFLKASLRGIIDSQTMNDTTVVDFVMAHNDKLNRKAEFNIWNATKEVLLTDDISKVGLMPEETWQQTADLFHDFGLLEEIPSIEESYTNDLVQEILSEGF